MADSANISLSVLRDGQQARVAALHLSGRHAAARAGFRVSAGHARNLCGGVRSRGDPIAYRIRGAVVALRKCDAAQIEVQP